MIPVSKALKTIEREVAPLKAERAELADGFGRILAEPIVADTDLPPFDRSQMDGYAVKASDTKKAPITLRLAGESSAGRPWRGDLRKGECVRIMTGAALPNGADAVQKVELTRESDDRVTILEPTQKGRFVVSKGKEIRSGAIAIRTGGLITEQNIAVAAAFGYSSVKVARRPRVAVISTGTELTEISAKPRYGEIRNSNAVMLKTMCEQAGAVTTVYPTVGDDAGELRSVISSAARSADILITTGGVSVGKYDLTKAAFDDLKAEVFFERVALKPGKPTVFARLRKSLIFGLPGNPVSSAVTFYLFVRKAILQMQSARATGLEPAAAVATRPFRSTKDRAAYLPASLEISGDGRLYVEPMRWHGSSDLVGFAIADVLVAVPKGVQFAAGDTVTILLLP